jgi:hypothetical protein
VKQTAPHASNSIYHWRKNSINELLVNLVVSVSNR